MPGTSIFKCSTDQNKVRYNLDFDKYSKNERANNSTAQNFVQSRPCH